jgi:hypothetical protein
MQHWQWLIGDAIHVAIRLSRGSRVDRDFACHASIDATRLPAVRPGDFRAAASAAAARRRLITTARDREPGTNNGGDSHLSPPPKQLQINVKEN